ncbi:Structural maintenance of chromosomes protein 2 [Myotis davidii]|uniref:Structural maintenance of chromosomes protein 2 n=1 Tax=Myotis davidii TaxID=225400 RepID=L5LLX4_MYODS|nr:Structural maintenance of chromosomes protein 2 [Myotis davidii]
MQELPPGGQHTPTLGVPLGYLDERVHSCSADQDEWCSHSGQSQKAMPPLVHKSRASLVIERTELPLRPIGFLAKAYLSKSVVKMHIKSIILEGFKSYAQRTEVNGFDPLFNAITGLNGSGKSNILDSICFLLGISNLSQVRASNLQDLVYKNGQAGITKASVSITFDNSDKKQSPLGFEVHDEITVTRQVVIGGRNKYLINGVNANNTRVQDLFCSVGLNVNNPHFLIMQGRITKVLNMKPPEILSMIEEAAGTRMYEYKKIAAQKTIEKKEAKLKEIKTILEEEITPTIQKLKEERSSYLEYQKVMREIEHLSRLYIAYQFLLAEDTKERSAEDLKEMQDKVQKLQEELSENDKKIKALNHEIEELEKRKDKEIGGVLRSLEDALAEAQRVNTKSQSAFDLKKKNLTGEENKRKELEKNMIEDSKTLAAKEKEVKKITDGLNTLQEASNKDAEALAAAQQHFNAVSAGLSSNEDGAEATLAGQMMACKNDISKAQTEAKQAQMKLKHAQQELKTKQAEVKKMDSGYRKDQEALEAVKKLKEKLEAEIKKLNYEENKEESLLEKRRQLSRDISRLKETYEALLARFPNLQFAYRDPEKNWNRNCVKGLVASLISVKDTSATTALELVAGERLYNVVVDTEVTGKKLLEKGELKRRYTIIPLNKISATCIAPETLRVAQNLVGPNNVHVALSLVEYKPELQKAMEFVFGTTFVCDNMDNAKKVAFDKRIMTRTVTRGGEVFDPHGTLSGGARSQAASILTKFQELKDVQDKLRIKENELQALEEELAEESEETLKNTKEIQRKAEEKYEVLENKMKNAEAEREKELKDAQKKLDCAKTKADASSKKMKEKQQEVEAITLELEELKREHASCEQQLEAVNEAIKSYEGQIEVMAVEVAKSKVSKMLKDYDWINAEKHLFGLPNSAYDFKTNNPKEAGHRLQKLQEMKEKLGRNVNMRAMNVLTEAEERYNDLMKKKRIVKNDKSKILATIEDLDQKKNQALNIAWQKVNKDFGSIFSTLLPGANAMLAPPEGQTVLDGLEFKVALGNTWKENLTELSGGQRSLVALSLILSMLLFKPAPIYILDEVDAALDLSHTQNIGQMLRTHFTHSQFIVVSLKEGMFNNANVLFKTKFVDGVSTVARFTQCQNGKVPKETKAKAKGPK